MSQKTKMLMSHGTCHMSWQLSYLWDTWLFIFGFSFKKQKLGKNQLTKQFLERFIITKKQTKQTTRLLIRGQWAKIRNVQIITEVGRDWCFQHCVFFFFFFVDNDSNACVQVPVLVHIQRLDLVRSRLTDAINARGDKLLLHNTGDTVAERQHTSK